jgi:uncharacterized membrane protein
MDVTKSHKSELSAMACVLAGVGNGAVFFGLAMLAQTLNGDIADAAPQSTTKP